MEQSVVASSNGWKPATYLPGDTLQVPTGPQYPAYLPTLRDAFQRFKNTANQRDRRVVQREVLQVEKKYGSNATTRMFRARTMLEDISHAGDDSEREHKSEKFADFMWNNFLHTRSNVTPSASGPCLVLYFLHTQYGSQSCQGSQSLQIVRKLQAIQALCAKAFVAGQRGMCSDPELEVLDPAAKLPFEVCQEDTVASKLAARQAYAAEKLEWAMALAAQVFEASGHRASKIDWVAYGSRTGRVVLDPSTFFDLLKTDRRPVHQPSSSTGALFERERRQQEIPGLELATLQALQLATRATQKPAEERLLAKNDRGGGCRPSDAGAAADDQLASSAGGFSIGTRTAAGPADGPSGGAGTLGPASNGSVHGADVSGRPWPQPASPDASNADSQAGAGCGDVLNAGPGASAGLLGRPKMDAAVAMGASIAAPRPDVAGAAACQENAQEPAPAAAAAGPTATTGGMAAGCRQSLAEHGLKGANQAGGMCVSRAAPTSSAAAAPPPAGCCQADGPVGSCSAADAAVLEVRECVVCGAQPPQTHLCGRCLSVRYCGAECQRAHWKQHKTTCKAIQAARADA